MKNVILSTTVSIAFACSVPCGVAYAQAPFIPEDPFGEPYGTSWTYLWNQGQIHDLMGNARQDVSFHSVGTNPSLYYMEEEVRLAWCAQLPDSLGNATDSLFRLDLLLTGEGLHGTTPVVVDPIGGVYNFYETHTPNGITGVGGGKRFVMENVYTAIDYHVLSNAWGPKLLLVVRPGGDPSQIVLRFEGMDSLQVDVDGMLRIYAGDKYVRLDQAVVYQQFGSQVSLVSWVPSYQHTPGAYLVTFDLDVYDTAHPLIFQITPFQPAAGGGGQFHPVPEWSTYVRGALEDALTDLDHDDQGYVYFTGFSNSSTGLPLTSGLLQHELHEDAIVGRFNQFYEIETSDTWMTYLGDAGSDMGRAVAYEPLRDRVVVGGSTGWLIGPAMPNTPLGSNPNCHQGTGSGFVAFLQAQNGQLDYRSQVVGQYEVAVTDLDTGPDGTIYFVGAGALVGGWSITDPPGAADYTVYPGAQTNLGYEGFVGRLSADADLVWLTSLGGPHDDLVHGCAVDADNKRLYVVGSTRTKNDPLVPDCALYSNLYEFPVCDAGGWFMPWLNGHPNAGLNVDGFITSFNLLDLSMAWSSYFGGLGNEVVTDVTVNSDGDVYITGTTDTHFYSSAPCVAGTDLGFPSCGTLGWQAAYAGQQDLFIARFDPATNLLWSSFHGGGQVEALGERGMRPRITVDEMDHVYLYAMTNSHTLVTPALPLAVPSSAHYMQPAHGDLTPGPQGNMDAYLGVFDPAGLFYYGTYFGGPGNEHSGGITAFNGRIYLSGRTTTPALFPYNCPNIPGRLPYCEPVPGGQGDGFMAQLVVSLTVGSQVPEGPIPAAFSVAPNPTAGLLTLALPGVEAPAEVLLTDALGRTAMRLAVATAHGAVVQVEQLPAGLYLVQVVAGNQRHSARFIKQ